MALVKISKGADIRHEYTDGVSRVPVLEGAYKDAAVERISLQPGAELSPALYSKTEHNQVFLITAGKGYIATPRRVFNITEVSVFVPDVDKEQITFRGVSQAWHYKEDFTGADIQQMMMIEHRNLGRLSMGANFGTGPNYIGQHIHNELEQWYIMLPGASFTYTAEDEKIHVEGGDITFTPHGSHHGSECAEGERFAYVWFELCENGYPGEIK